MHFTMSSARTRGSSPLTMTYRSASTLWETSQSRSVAVSQSGEVMITLAPKPSATALISSLSVAT